MSTITTARLDLRRLTVDDAPFILRLVNEPSWLRFIGDKRVHTLEDARGYLEKGPIDMYRRLGFGLYLAELRDGAVAIGICGLIQRESLPDVDVGFAFLPEYWGKGYGYESASAVLAYGKREFALKRIVAITSPDNRQSIRVLERLGMTLEGSLDLRSDGAKTLLFAGNL
jgi:RimJ/RimL family protein N-acetyltransferase